MKTLIRSLYAALIFPVLFFLLSCERSIIPETGKGKAEFFLSKTEEESKSYDASQEDGISSYHILVSVEDVKGNPVVSDSLIPVYAFGPGFTSESLELETGEYLLTSFMVINPAGEVIFASPLEGSPLAYLVMDPLPLSFDILPDKVTKVVPEVLFVGTHTPGDFGYTSFGMQIIKPLHFWTVCVLDPGNPLIMAPIQLTTAKLTVFAPDGWRYTFRLEASVNHLVIRGGYAGYVFLLEKDGYMPQRLWVSTRELLSTSGENPLVLKIPWDSNRWRTLILQPGPDDGKDAMVSNLEPDKNFGDHKYFEATFLSEPVLTVMRSNRSLIWFDLGELPKSAVIRKVTLQLFYDIPIPWDNSVFITYPVTSSLWHGGVLQQIVEPWEEDNVTWNTQPKTIEANQVYISPFNLNCNFIEVDVTRLFVPVQEIAAPNHGMLFRLWPTERFPGFRFASSDYPAASMRPKLTVYYTIN